MAKKLGLALMSVLLVLLVAEVFVRLFIGPAALLNVVNLPASFRAEPNFPGVPFVLRPNAEAVHRFTSNPDGYFDGDGTLTYRTNALGLRGDETTREKPPGVFRILGLGDSYTFGSGVRREHLFLERLEARFADDTGMRIEVLNLGIPGFTTWQEVALLEHVGVGFDPDLVLISFVMNDVGGFLPGARVEAGPSWLSGVADVSWLAGHVKLRILGPRTMRRVIEERRRSFGPRAPGWLAAQRALARAKRLADAEGFALVLLIFPNMWEIDGTYPFEGLHAIIAAAAGGLGIPVIDLLDAFREVDRTQFWVHPNDQHPNHEAHGLAARCIEQALRERGAVPR